MQGATPCFQARPMTGRERVQLFVERFLLGWYDPRICLVAQRTKSGTAHRLTHGLPLSGDLAIIALTHMTRLLFPRFPAFTPPSRAKSGFRTVNLG